MRFAVLEPTAADSGPDKAFEQLMSEVVQIMHGFFLWFIGFDVLGLQFTYHFEHVAGVPFENREERTMAAGTVGSND